MSSRKKVLCAARRYALRGWCVVPVPYREKAPRLQGWQKLQLKEPELTEHFHKHTNVGLLLGKPSNRLTDIDVDCPEAIFLARYFLPDTGRIFGHRSKPSSHYLFYSKSNVDPEKLADVDGTSLVEIRSAGQQTVVPPSIHPSGEKIRWNKKHRAARISSRKLRKTVRRLAAATILARHWPEEGSRNEAALALAGMLLRAGWEEEDVAEFIESVAQAAEDEEFAERKKTVFATSKRLGKGKDVTGRPKLADLLSADAVDRACEWLGINAARLAEERTPSTKHKWPKTLRDKALYGLAGDFVRAIAPQTEADPAGILLQFLVAFGNACGRQPSLQWGRAIHHTNLFCVLVGHTAKSRKGTAWEEVASFFAHLDSEWLEGRVQSGLSSGEGLIWAVRDPIEKQKTNKKTGEIESTIEDAGVEDKRLLVLEEEFASPLRVIRREGNTLSAVIRNAWGRGNLSSLTKNSPAQATRAHISIIGHITDNELLRELTANEGSNGFGNRFLWGCVRRSQFLPFGGEVDEKLKKAFVTQCMKALFYARRPRQMFVSKHAKELWKTKYRKLSAGSPGLLGAITSRGEAQVLRLSMLYALLDRSQIIRRRHLRAAMSVWRYCEDSARHIFSDRFGDPVVDHILAALRKSHRGLTRNEIREIFSHNRGDAEITRALDLLREYGLARSVSEVTGGRPAERWFATQ